MLILAFRSAWCTDRKYSSKTPLLNTSFGPVCVCMQGRNKYEENALQWAPHELGQTITCAYFFSLILYERAAGRHRNRACVCPRWKEPYGRLRVRVTVEPAGTDDSEGWQRLWAGRREEPVASRRDIDIGGEGASWLCHVRDKRIGPNIHCLTMSVFIFLGMAVALLKHNSYTVLNGVVACCSVRWATRHRLVCLRASATDAPAPSNATSRLLPRHLFPSPLVALLFLDKTFDILPAASFCRHHE